MFGADTPLIMDAIQIAVLSAGAGAGVVLLAVLRRRPTRTTSRSSQRNGSDALEARVAVLERIATDQSIGLANEIEALRDTAQTRQKGNAS